MCGGTSRIGETTKTRAETKYLAATSRRRKKPKRRPPRFDSALFALDARWIGARPMLSTCKPERDRLDLSFDAEGKAGLGKQLSG